MIQDIVVNLTVGRPHDPALDYAVSVARTFEADLSGVAFCYDPIVVPDAMEGMSADLMEVQRVENAKAAEEAVARFKRAAKKVELPAEAKTVQASVAGAPHAFGCIARLFDLSIAGQSEPGKSLAESLIAEAALFESGRPVIIVPYIQKDGFKLDRVMVCWDGSRTAARALADAMPLLEFAKAVEVVIVANGHTKSNEDPGAAVVQHLAHHGLKAETKRVMVGESDVASTLLSHAADSSADMMVMGGYGHSRLREFILGGVTRGILGTMTVPVLMSH
jgi:nucleotide-binding universal stress UspA family protein